MEAFEKHGGLDRDDFRLTYADTYPDLTVFSFPNSQDDIDELKRHMRFDLVTKWHMVVDGPTSLPNTTYHRKIGWSVADRPVTPRTPKALFEHYKPSGLVYFHHPYKTQINPAFWEAVIRLGDTIDTRVFPSAHNEIYDISQLLIGSDDWAVLATCDTWEEAFEALFDLDPKPFIFKQGLAIDLWPTLVGWNGSNATTPLCLIGSQTATDKAVDHTRLHHRHGYTSLYHMLLRQYRGTAAHVAEIGILEDASIRMWRQYFGAKATVYGFDVNTQSLAMSEADVVGELNVGDKTQMEVALTRYAPADGFDVMIDDSSHRLADMLRIIVTVLPYVKRGGLLILEDIFKQIPLTQFYDALELVQHLIETVDVYDIAHDRQETPRWDNNRVMVIKRAK